MSDTLKHLEEIEARVEKTTPGEWTCWGGGGYVSIGLDRPCEISEKKLGANHGDGIDRGAGRDYIFMAHSHQDVPWLCARLRDALEVIEALHIKECRRDLLPLNGYPFIHASNDPKWTFGTCGDEAVVAAYRRLFGEEESRG